MIPRTPLDAWIARKIGRTDFPLTRANLEAFQLDKLRETLRQVSEKSCFYRRHLAGMPLDVAELGEISRLPFTTADDIRANPLGFVCVSQDEIQRVVTLDSSGTTGQPKRIYFTLDDQALTTDFFHIGMSTFTAPGDRVLILLPGETPGSVGDLLAIGLKRLGAVAIKHGPVRDAAATLDVMKRENINVLVGVPTHVLALARLPVSPALRIKSVLLSTDHVPNAIKRAIENAWNCTVYNHYGMTEMGLGGGVECQARRGYHLREADMLFEIVDPVSGEPLPEGEPGEVVFTTLTRRGMPLVRYRTGDISQLIPGVCPCGTTLNTLSRITHRLDGRVAVGGKILTMANLDEMLFAIEGVLNFTAEVIRHQGHDCLNLQVQLADDQALNAIARTAAQTLPCEVKVLPVPAIPPGMAKRRIIDRRTGTVG